MTQKERNDLIRKNARQKAAGYENNAPQKRSLSGQAYNSGISNGGSMRSSEKKSNVKSMDTRRQEAQEKKKQWGQFASAAQRTQKSLGGSLTNSTGKSTETKKSTQKQQTKERFNAGEEMKKRREAAKAQGKGNWNAGEETKRRKEEAMKKKEAAAKEKAFGKGR